MDGGSWWATVHGVAKSQTQLSTQACELDAYVTHNSKMHIKLPLCTYCKLAKIKKINVTVLARFRKTSIIEHCEGGE